MKQNTDLNDEIDLRELARTLWRGKFYIIIFWFVTVFLSSMYLQYAEKKYTVVYKLKPVSESERDPVLSNFGGLASIAGIQVPSSNNNDYLIFRELISSIEVSEFIILNKDLIRDIYASEWNLDLKVYSEPPKSKIKILIGDFIKTLTGVPSLSYEPPNAKRLAAFISKNFQIIEDNDTKFLSISAESSDPDTMLSLILKASEVSDNIMRQRYIDFSIEPLAFYKEKLRTARSREHREALAGLISAEEQKLMLASKGKYFTAEPYINPTTSIYPTTPKPVLVLVLGSLLGLLFGCIFILMRNVIVKDNL